MLWQLWVAELRVNLSGGLARVGYLHEVMEVRPYVNNLPQRHLELSEYRGGGVDVMTIGDSFSNASWMGENVYYQDHLATKQGLRVLNVKAYCEGGAQPHLNLIKLVNSDLFDRIKPRYVILEVVERHAVKNLGKNLDFAQRATPEEIECYARFDPDPGYPRAKPSDFITTANAKFVLNRLHYLISDHNVGKTVFLARLRQPLFSVKEPDLLAYWHEDTANIRAATPEAVQKVNANLNTLAQMIAAKGSRLVFMPAVDKYNLYRDYLVDDTMPRSEFFERLRPLPKNYLFIDTKAILADEVAKGEKDVFFSDDTHWSSKAGAAIFSRFVFP
jgi:hypothetical protein